MVPLTSIAERFTIGSHARPMQNNSGAVGGVTQASLPDASSRLPSLLAHITIAVLCCCVSPWREFRRALSVNDRAGDGDVRKFLPIRSTAQHQSATTHVAATDKVRRKSQSLAKICQQGVDILAGGDAPEKDDLAVNWQIARQMSRVPFDGYPIAWIVLVNVHGGKFAKVIQTDSRPGVNEAARRRDHEHAGQPARRPRERIRIGNLAAKVEAAEKSEDIANRCAVLAA